MELKNIDGPWENHGRDTSERSHRGNNDEDESIENKLEDPTLFSPKKIRKCKKKNFIEIYLVIGADCCASMTFIELPDSFHVREAVVALKKKHKNKRSES